jgi:hypothetical protein
MSRRLREIDEAIKAESGVVQHHILVEPVRADGFCFSGWSLPKGGIIHAPAGRTDRELYTLAHECAHVALRHDHRKPRWRREYEAELWAHAALERHGVAVPHRDGCNAALNVFLEIEEAVKRGRFGRPKWVAGEAAEWSGWNYAVTADERGS